MPEATTPPDSKERLFEVTIDENSVGHPNPSVEHEREVAIFDLLEGNSFILNDYDVGPYKLKHSVEDGRLSFKIGNKSVDEVVTHLVPFSPFRRIVKDYFIICESYYDAIRSASSAKIQAIDVNRRAMHDEGTRLLVEKLDGKITLDFDTARRLYTLVCALHWKG